VGSALRAIEEDDETKGIVELRSSNVVDLAAFKAERARTAAVPRRDAVVAAIAVPPIAAPDASSTPGESNTLTDAEAFGSRSRPTLGGRPSWPRWTTTPWRARVRWGTCRAALDGTAARDASRVLSRPQHLEARLL
jgi:hypothetical protein